MTRKALQGSATPCHPEIEPFIRTGTTVLPGFGIMSNHLPALPRSRRPRLTLPLALFVVGAALVGITAAPLGMVRGEPGSSVIGLDPGSPPLEAPGRRGPATPPGEADGVVPEGVTVFDDDYPAVANLDPELLAALRQAATDAGDDGIVFIVNSGWRSSAYQEQLFREAIAEYGSAEEAARWVATAETSRHVSGDAVDIGPGEATAWLSEHGAAYGLCQIYRNEPWHYELRPQAIEHGCPPMYDDPTHDPALQR